MENIAIVGGGIIGMTLANYLDSKKFDITLYDQPVGQATKASAGIISPWLSKRRNKQWYALAKAGAAFFPKLVQDFDLDTSIYKQSGTLLLRKESQLEELYTLAEKRQAKAPELGEIRLLEAEETVSLFPLLKPTPSLYVSGGGRLDGQAYLQHLRDLAKIKGVHLENQRVHLQQAQSLKLADDGQVLTYDRIILAPGPHLKELLAPLGIQADVRPQKGQLLVFNTSEQQSSAWPVVMLDGEADLIPFENGRILLGATHENEEEWDLSPTSAAFQQLTSNAANFLANPEHLFNHPYEYRVGTRAYTSDFSPFFGAVNDGLLVASGLGSSGLTTGPYIGYLLAEYLNGTTIHWDIYQKPLNNYLKPIK
ncbi:NAD(P)/FAD-dependent oxidoreductase [Enterococcus sp. AZ109]|uniref:NAD(P)/FAD-dependent oxidoreductase n=1 Tax=Enterococcus sp. AZ109 TaxID=2774634 RepID=UPI003F1FECDD